MPGGDRIWTNFVTAQGVQKKKNHFPPSNHIFRPQIPKIFSKKISEGGTICLFWLSWGGDNFLGLERGPESDSEAERGNVPSPVPSVLTYARHPPIFSYVSLILVIVVSEIQIPKYIYVGSWNIILELPKLQLGLFGMLKLALVLQFIVTNAYFSVVCNTKVSVHARLK